MSSTIGNERNLVFLRDRQTISNSLTDTGRFCEISLYHLSDMHALPEQKIRPASGAGGGVAGMEVLPV